MKKESKKAKEARLRGEAEAITSKLWVTITVIGKLQNQYNAVIEELRGLITKRR